MGDVAAALAELAREYTDQDRGFELRHVAGGERLVDRGVAVERAVTGSADRHHPVAAAMLGKAMSPFVVRPGRQFAGHPHPSHPGQEFLFVHAGQAELSYHGDIVTLTQGDCAYIDASVPHKLRQLGDQPAVVIVVAYDEPRAARR